MAGEDVVPTPTSSARHLNFLSDKFEFLMPECLNSFVGKRIHHMYQTLYAIHSGVGSRSRERSYTTDVITSKLKLPLLPDREHIGKSRWHRKRYSYSKGLQPRSSPRLPTLVRFQHCHSLLHHSDILHLMLSVKTSDAMHRRPKLSCEECPSKTL